VDEDDEGDDDGSNVNMDLSHMIINEFSTSLTQIRNSVGFPLNYLRYVIAFKLLVQRLIRSDVKSYRYQVINQSPITLEKRVDPKLFDRCPEGSNTPARLSVTS
jgi:hypothetical protein